MTTQSDEAQRIRGYLQAQANKLSLPELVEKVRHDTLPLREAAAAFPSNRFFERPGPADWSAAEVLTHVLEMNERGARAIEGIFSVFPDLRFETRRAYIREDLVVQEWTARGTHEGTMTRSGMEVPPTGRKVEYKGMDVIPIRDGLVARKDVYSDSVTLLRQLGLTSI